MYMTRLPLEGTYNTRELGGYPTKTGATAWGKFLRSDSLNALTVADMTYLKKYPVTTIIDLRSHLEIETQPDPVITDIDYYHIPLAAGDITEKTTSQIEGQAATFIEEFYLQCLTNSGGKIKEIIEVSAKSPGCVLFHCAAGKDRTGIIAALLLSLAGVADEDIVANYQITYTYLKANPQFTKDSVTYPRELIYSAPHYIKKVLNYINEHYQTVENYLLAIDCPKEQLEMICSNFIHTAVMSN